MNKQTLFDTLIKTPIIFNGCYEKLISYSTVDEPYVNVVIIDRELNRTYLLTTSQGHLMTMTLEQREEAFLKVLMDNNHFYDINTFTTLSIQYYSVKNK